MGKTNMLDAIYVLCMCKSYVSYRQSDIIQSEKDFVRLVGHFSIDDDVNKVVIKYPRRGAKNVAVNDLKYQKLKEHIGLLPVVIITPDDVKLLIGGSVERRALIDNTLCQIDRGYLEALSIYNHVLKQKGQLVKMENADIEVLKIYNNQLSEQAAIIYDARKVFFESFESHVQACYRDITNDKEQIQLQYKSQLLESPLDELLRTNLQKELIVRRSLYGIHKDDMELIMDGHSVKSYASQGQRKSILLALRLAQVELLKNRLLKQPIILLDDLFDKLDAHRVKSLIALLINRDFGQIFITDTSKNRVADAVENLGIEPTWLQISHGKIIE